MGRKETDSCDEWQEEPIGQAPLSVPCSIVLLLTIVAVWPPMAFSSIYQHGSVTANGSRDNRSCNSNREHGQTFLFFSDICAVFNYSFLLIIPGDSGWLRALHLTADEVRESWLFSKMNFLKKCTLLKCIILFIRMRKSSEKAGILNAFKKNFN